jgi:alpha-mannosidase
LLFNPTLISHRGIITLPADVLDTHTVNTACHQTITHLDGTAAVLVSITEPLPQMGYCTPLLAPPDADDVPSDSALHVEDCLLENRFLRVEFAENGEITSLWDKEAQRDVLVNGEHGNRFQLYEDQPGRYDAWDIVASYVENELEIDNAASLTIEETGPLRVSLKLVRQCHQSTITQRISLTADSRQLTFETSVDWQEQQKLLKVGFPVDVNARHATCDIAYGTIERATHRNTSHDAARFEVPAHRWMDVSEANYGVALLNDCKYGHEANQHWLRLTLLRGSISPDPTADQHGHHFTYVLYPHTGNWRDASVNDTATWLNTPLHARRVSQPHSATSWIQCNASNITVEATKVSEDGESLIVRLVERQNTRTPVTLTLSFPVQIAHTCDLLENPEQVLSINTNQIELIFQPCEIITLSLTPVRDDRL